LVLIDQNQIVGDVSRNSRRAQRIALEFAQFIEPRRRPLTAAAAQATALLNRTNLHKALTNYAIQHAGTDAELDSDLEAGATDHLLQQNSER